MGTKEADPDEKTAEEGRASALERKAACQHHWMIPTPAGPVSIGTCRSCGEEREFQNYIEGGGGWSPTRRSRGGARKGKAR